jgi:peroxiredoxin
MNVGDIAPNFKLKDETGKEFELYDNLNQKILIAFYPKDDTPVCSNQLADYNDNLDEFIRNGIKVVGISADSVQSHSNFCNKLNLKFPLLADEKKLVSKQYDALNFLKMNKRQLVLIAQNKKVVWIDSTIAVNYLKTEEIIEKLRSIDSKEMT